LLRGGSFGTIRQIGDAAREWKSVFTPTRHGPGLFFSTPHPGEPRMATKPVTAKLRLRLELIAALPEPIMLDRPRRLSKAELTLFRRLYGIRECCCKGRCKIQHFMLRATSAAKLGRSRRLAARLVRELRDNPTSMYQTRCQCAACRQSIPPIPFAAHQLLAQRLVPEGETAPHRPRMKPNRRRQVQNAA
jgi:hypothetical protein